MYAVIETGGKQYRVEVGTELAVELLDVEPGQEITIERVLLVADGDEAAIGRPIVADAAVSATVLRNDRADKVIVVQVQAEGPPPGEEGPPPGADGPAHHRRPARREERRRGRQRRAEAAKTERERLEEAAARQAAADAALAAMLAAEGRRRGRRSRTAQAAGHGRAGEEAAPGAGAKAAPNADDRAPQTGAAPAAKRTRAPKKED